MNNLFVFTKKKDDFDATTADSIDSIFFAALASRQTNEKAKPNFPESRALVDRLIIRLRSQCRDIRVGGTQTTSIPDRRVT